MKISRVINKACDGDGNVIKLHVISFAITTYAGIINPLIIDSVFSPIQWQREHLEVIFSML